MKNNKYYDRALCQKLKNDIAALGLPTDFILELRRYNKRYNGRYFIREQRIVLFLFNYYTQKEKSYDQILRTLMHEVLHHFQYCYTDYVRKKGVMHDHYFKRSEREYNEMITDMLGVAP